MLPRNYSVDDFKKWMKDQKQFGIEKPKPSPSNLIGMAVESKLTIDRTAANMKAQAGNVDEMAKEFVETGGTIIETKGKEFLIEVDSGTFFMRRSFVKKSAS